MNRALEIEGLSAKYAEHTVLQDIDLCVALGEWFALLGPNGSGKTSLLRCMAGVLAPSAGRVRVCGHPMQGAAPAAKQQIGYACAVEQLPGLLTGAQCLEVYAAAKGRDDIDAQILSLAEQLRFTEFLHRSVDTYSLGTRQKLCVLLALLGAPQLIILDETFNGLDPASALRVKRHLRALANEGQCAIVLATHALDIVERYADRAALLINGRIAKNWTSDDLAAMRGEGVASLETAMAAAMETSDQ